MDLTKILKPGDKVWTIQHGWVEVESVSDNTFDEVYPLRTMNSFGRVFEDCLYTCEGKFKKGDKNPSLFLKEQVLDLSIPEPVFEKGELVWALFNIVSCPLYWFPATYSHKEETEAGDDEIHFVFVNQIPKTLDETTDSVAYVRKWEDSPFKDQAQ